MKLSVQNLVWRTIDGNLLDGISLEIDPGEICVLAGAPGSGRTTLLRCLAGLDCPDSGEICCGRHSLIAYPGTACRWVGYVPQIFPEDSDRVTQFLDFYRCLAGADPAVRQKELQRLTEFAGLGEWCNTRIRRLSTAQKRQLWLARALIFEPPFLALDEPFTGLTADEGCVLRQMIQYLAGTGKGILLTALPDCAAATFGGRLLRLDSGAIAATGEGRRI